MTSEELILKEMQHMRSEMSKGFRECRNDIKHIHTKIDTHKDGVSKRITSTNDKINEVDKKFINKNWKLIIGMIVISAGSGGIGSLSADMVKKYLSILM